MDTTALEDLARAAGIAVRWHDVFGTPHDVSPQTLRSLLAALGMPAGDDAQVAQSLAELGRPAGRPPPLVTAEAGSPVTIPFRARHYRLELEDGRSFEGEAEAVEGGVRLPAILEAGYHRVQLDDHELVVAVAPERCFTVTDGATAARWGLAVQLYALRRAGDGGIGDFRGLAEFVRSAAAHGAAAVAISPVHAQFTADPDRFSPYAPSSRVMLNVLHAPLDEAPADIARDAVRRCEALELVDWPVATRARLDVLRAWFERIGEDAALGDAVRRFRAAGGEALETHAVFEALHAELFGGDTSLWNWRSWPAALQDPSSAAVRAFGQTHQHEVAFHVFLQFLADRGLGEAQLAARDAGMPIGLVADLAVGTDAGGSHCWSRQAEMLLGLSVGAPPDLLSRDGQSWGLAAFSPRGLVLNGFRAFIEMVQAALRHAGGVRIDHGMGLNRLWVIPDGVKASEGAYLAYPEQDLLRLVRLESYRHHAVVLAEDLGTVPEGFQGRLQASGIFGMRVLAFEREEAAFTPPAGWEPQAVAMSSTHDLPPVAGWWAGLDLAWRARLDLFGEGGLAKEEAAREADRALLWSAFCDSGAAAGAPPAPDDTGPVVDAAIRHLGRSACLLVMLPVEDALALREQPNLPGTTDEHPNWRRRLDGPAEHVLDAAPVATRLAQLAQARNA